MRQTKRLIGAAAFESYYAALFGNRWTALREALFQETKPVAFSVCGGKPYYLDRASIYAAQALPSTDKGCYLDMCAAPGGKTLVLASGMGQDAHIQANELSRSRRARLLTVLAEHMPPDIRSRIEVTGYDAAILPRYRQAGYDRILLDAPCSSERHLMTDAKYLDCWTPARIKMLAQRQWALLSAAFLLLKPGGFLVYATCALTDAENDGVVQRLLKKYGNEAVIRNTATAVSDETAFAMNTSGEKMLFGCRFLPDTAAGAGPLYFSLIEKLDHTNL